MQPFECWRKGFLHCVCPVYIKPKVAVLMLSILNASSSNLLTLPPHYSWFSANQDRVRQDGDRIAFNLCQEQIGTVGSEAQHNRKYFIDMFKAYWVQITLSIWASIWVRSFAWWSSLLTACSFINLDSDHRSAEQEALALLPHFFCMEHILGALVAFSS